MRFVIYDQFHWRSPDHLVRYCENWKEALEHYQFYKDLMPGESLGLTTEKDFKKMLEAMKPKSNNITEHEQKDRLLRKKVAQDDSGTQAGG